MNGISNNNVTALLYRHDLQAKKRIDADAAVQNFGTEMSDKVQHAKSDHTGVASAIQHNTASAALSGETYFMCHQSSISANNLETRQAAEHKALMDAAKHSPEMRRISKTVAPSQTSTTILPTDSTEVKLEKLREIADKADYTGMTYEEIYTDIWNRYNDAFDGQLSAITFTGGISLEWIEINNQFVQEAEKNVYIPLRNEFLAKGIDRDDLSYNKEYMERVSDIRSSALGYKNMTFEEKEAAILEKYKGKNSFLDFLNMQGELDHTLVNRNKMGAEGANAYAWEIFSSIQSDFSKAQFTQTAQGQIHSRSWLSPNEISQTEWDSYLQKDFNIYAFFAAMKDSVNKTIFNNYDYDIQGFLNNQIDSFLGILDSHWGRDGM